MSANTGTPFGAPFAAAPAVDNPYRDPMHDELFGKALASVRRMCVDYAAYQTSALATELTRLTSQCDDLNANLATSGLECVALRAQRDALLALLAECRPLVKGRLADDPSHGDPALLDRIAAALDHP